MGIQGNIQAIIFDLDGVIIDSNPVIESFWKSWTDRENIDLTQAMIREWIYGRKVGDTLTGIFNHLTDERKKEIALAAYEFDGTIQPSAIPGMIDFLAALTAMHIPTGVVTSSHHPRMLKMLTTLGIENNFNFFITAHEVTRGKPDPEPYLKMSEKMHIPNAHCLVFEDAISGIQSATAAGMFSIGIGNREAAPILLSHGAIDVIADFTHIQLTREEISLDSGNRFKLMTGL